MLSLGDVLVRSKARRPQDIRPDEIEAMLEAVPDLRDELREATPDELPS